MTAVALVPELTPSGRLSEIDAALRARGLDDASVPWWALALLDLEPGSDMEQLRRDRQEGRTRWWMGHLGQPRADYEPESERLLLWHDLVHLARRTVGRMTPRQAIAEMGSAACRHAACTSVRALVQFIDLRDDDMESWVPRDFHVRAVRYMRTASSAVILLPFAHGKQICDSELVVTPDGWRRHGDLAVGDLVYGPDGRPTPVIAVSPRTMATLRVTFRNGQTIDCHPRHEWTVYNRHPREYETVETQELASRGLLDGTRSKFFVDKPEPLEMPERDLPMDPYTLGVWLGNGSVGKGVVTHDVDDFYGIPYAKRAAWQGADGARNVSTSFVGLLDDLRTTGVADRKHVPHEYLWASRQQRWDLLCGLIDTDGCVDERGVRFTNTNPHLINSIEHLARSFGYRTSRTSQRPTLSTGGVQGRQTVYTVSWSPHDGMIPSRLERKQRLGARRFTHTRIGIVSIDTCDPVPGRCITVARADGLYLVGETMIPTHNSATSSIIVPLADWVENPEATQIRIYRSRDYTQQWTMKLMAVVESNEALHVLTDGKVNRPGPFDTSKLWTVRDGFALAGKTIIDPSFRPLTITGAITGLRADRIGVDDLVDERNAVSRNVMDKFFNLLHSGVFTAERVRTGKAWTNRYGTRWGNSYLIGTIFDKRDVNYRMFQEFREREQRNETGYVTVRESIYPHRHARAEGTTLWPEKVPIAKALELENKLGQRAFRLRCMNLPMQDGTEVFPAHWVERAVREELPYGRRPPEGCHLYIGYDPALGKRNKGSKFPAAVVLGYNNDLDLWYFLRYERWSIPAPEQVRRLIAWATELHCPVVVEGNNIQESYEDWIHELASSVQVITRPTGSAKHDIDDGVESFRPLFEADRIRICAGGAPHELLQEFKEEWLNWPTGTYKDMVMASWFSLYQLKLRHRPRAKVYTDPVPSFVANRGYRQTVDLSRYKT